MPFIRKIKNAPVIASNFLLPVLRYANEPIIVNTNERTVITASDTL